MTESPVKSMTLAGPLGSRTSGRRPICANLCQAASASSGTIVSKAAARLSSEVSSPRTNRP
jgi:hypothetical protein